MIFNKYYTNIRYNEQMEDLMDKAYEKFVIRKEGSTKQRKRIKKSYDAEAQLLEVDITSFHGFCVFKRSLC